MDSGGVCTKTVTQLILNLRVGHYRIDSKGEYLLYHELVTFLLVNSSVLSRGSVWEFATWYYFVLPCRERPDADHFRVHLKCQDISPQVALPEQAG